MEHAKIHDRVTRRHPELTQEDVLSAWANAIALVRRESVEKDFYVAVGFDANGRAIEMVAARDEDGTLIIFHAMTPPSKKTLGELRIGGGLS